MKGDTKIIVTSNRTITIENLVLRIVGVLRFQLFTMLKKNRIKYIGLKQHLGKDAHLRIFEKGKIQIGKAVYLSDRSSLEVRMEGQIEIGDNNFFNSNNNIVCFKSIKIGNNNLFAQNVVIVDHNHNFDSLEKLICKQGYKCESVEIGSDCWICANTVICAGSYIGDHIVVAANSVVNSRLEKPGVYGGTPAKLIRER